MPVYIPATTTLFDLIYTDHAASIAIGGAGQTVMPINRKRALMFFLNESDTNMRIAWGPQSASATVGFLVQPLYYFEPPVAPTENMTVYCAASGKQFSAGEFTYTAA